jgi:hypothetical protein
LVLFLVDVLENILEATIILLQDGILGGHVLKGWGIRLLIPKVGQ